VSTTSVATGRTDPKIRRRRATDRALSRRRRRPAVVAVAATAVALVLLVILAAQIFRSDQGRHRELDERTSERAALAQEYIDSYIGDLVDQLQTHARLSLSGPAPTAAEFTRTAMVQRSSAAVLLDGNGRLLQVYPEKPEILGQDMSARYAHLSGALAGRPTVSVVVPSAATGIDIVAVAVPFDTPGGRRVFSAGFEISQTPLMTFLHNVTHIDGHLVFLVDTNDAIVGGDPTGVTGKLSTAEPELVGVDGDREVTRAGTDYWYTSRDVASAPWRIIVMVPDDSLYRPLDEGRALPWLLFGAFAIVSVLIVALMIKVSSDHDHMLRAARLDGLTGIANRRYLDTQIATLEATTSPWAMIMVDIDHFKAVNDRHGHLRGDDVLRHVAGLLTATVRPSDTVGRWGGEEFLVLLPDATLNDARVVADRILRIIATTPDPCGIAVTVSIGYAATNGSGDGLIDLADAGMYQAKQGGRARIATVAPVDAFPVLTSS